MKMAVKKIIIVCKVGERKTKKALTDNRKLIEKMVGSGRNTRICEGRGDEI